MEEEAVAQQAHTINCLEQAVLDAQAELQGEEQHAHEAQAQHAEEAQEELDNEEPGAELEWWMGGWANGTCFSGQVDKLVSEWVGWPWVRCGARSAVFA